MAAFIVCVCLLWFEGFNDIMNWLIGRVKGQLGWLWKFQTLREWSSEALVMAQGQLETELTQEVWPISVLISLPLQQGRGGEKCKYHHSL